MKKYKQYGKVKKGSEVLQCSFTIKISLIPDLFHLEMQHMFYRLGEEAAKYGYTKNELTMYASLEEDRRHCKTIPKGYRTFRYCYTHQKNFTYVPSYPK